jgi:hypothetical protein
MRPFINQSNLTFKRNNALSEIINSKKIRWRFFRENHQFLVS